MWLSPSFALAFEQWRRACGSEDLPRAADFRPMDLPFAMLPYVIVLALEDAAPRFRYEFVGSEAAFRFGMDPTGWLGHEVLRGALHAYATSLIDECIAERAPLYSESLFRWATGVSVATRRLLLPATGERGIGRIVAIQFLAPGASRDVERAYPVHDIEQVEEKLRAVIRGPAWPLHLAAEPPR
jgi:hypothetical protein